MINTDSHNEEVTMLDHVVIGLVFTVKRILAVSGDLVHVAWANNIVERAVFENCTYFTQGQIVEVFQGDTVEVEWCSTWEKVWNVRAVRAASNLLDAFLDDERAELISLANVFQGSPRSASLALNPKP